MNRVQTIEVKDIHGNPVTIPKEEAWKIYAIMRREGHIEDIACYYPELMDKITDDEMIDISYEMVDIKENLINTSEAIYDAIMYTYPELLLEDNK